VPGQIVVAVVAELTLYGFWHCEGLFAELLRILEKDGRRMWRIRSGSRIGESIGLA
jgi:hypothetical protein